MDKETLSNYGWIVICTLVLAVMIALATPFGEYIKDGVWSTTNGLNDVNNQALGIVIGDNNTKPTLAGATFVDGTFKTWDELKNEYNVTDDAIGYDAFNDCKDLLSLDMPDTIVSIGNNAFYGCTSLVSINISDNVTNMGTHIFYGCELLTEVNLPEGITGISEFTFYGCKSLANIIIPDSVTSIGNSSFIYCESLENVVFPDNVTYIGAASFNSCNSLKSITLPKNCKTFGGLTFWACPSLSIVNFKGTIAEWNAIPKSMVFQTNIEVICTDGTTTL